MHISCMAVVGGDGGWDWRGGGGEGGNGGRREGVLDIHAWP